MDNSIYIFSANHARLALPVLCLPPSSACCPCSPPIASAYYLYNSSCCLGCHTAYCRIASSDDGRLPRTSACTFFVVAGANWWHPKTPPSYISWALRNAFPLGRFNWYCHIQKLFRVSFYHEEWSVYQTHCPNPQHLPKWLYSRSSQCWKAGPRNAAHFWAEYWPCCWRNLWLMGHSF